jgi:Outer membrane efflux protein
MFLILLIIKMNITSFHKGTCVNEKWLSEKTSLGLRVLLCLLILIVPCGCSLTNKSISYLGNEELGYYRDVATKIEYPVLEDDVDHKAFATTAPRRLSDLEKSEIWDVTLIEVLHTALANNHVLRESSQFLSPFNTLMRNPNGSSTIYDPAIQESGVQGNQRGVEAALSDFDAQVTTSLLWGRDENVQNNVFSSNGLPPGDTLIDETLSLNSRVQKTMATGGTFSISNNLNYSRNNTPTRLFRSVYTDTLRAEYRQPLRAGAGIDFTRIAGPIGTNINSGLGSVDRGVVISRINNDIAIADFEINVRNMLHDVEFLYWDLSQAYRVYHSETKASINALKTYKIIAAKSKPGLRNTRVNDKFQAEVNYLEARSRAEDALANLFSVEGQLRRIMGLPVNDGRIIRPVEEPMTAEFIPDWDICKVEALSQRVELRKQKWDIKKLEFSLKAAKSLTRSRFDFVMNYQVNGFGNNLIGDKDDDGTTIEGYHNVWGSLTQGNQTGGNIGFEFSKAFGNRAAHSQVNFQELSLTRSRVFLVEQEMEISAELASAFQNLDSTYKRAGTKFNQRIAAEKFLRANEKSYEANLTELDLLLQAQVRLSSAETEYYQSLIEYNKAITEIHFRKGTLLQHNNVTLAEGGWDQEAYDDALRRAEERTHAFKGRLLRDSKPFPFVKKPNAAYDFEHHQYIEGSSGEIMEFSNEIPNYSEEIPNYHDLQKVPDENETPLLPVPKNDSRPQEPLIPLPQEENNIPRDKTAQGASEFGSSAINKSDKWKKTTLMKITLKKSPGPVLIHRNTNEIKNPKPVSTGWKSRKLSPVINPSPVLKSSPIINPKPLINPSPIIHKSVIEIRPAIIEKSTGWKKHNN